MSKFSITKPASLPLWELKAQNPIIIELINTTNTELWLRRRKINNSTLSIVQFVSSTHSIPIFIDSYELPRQPFFFNRAFCGHGKRKTSSIHSNFHNTTSNRQSETQNTISKGFCTIYTWIWMIEEIFRHHVGVVIMDGAKLTSDSWSVTQRTIKYQFSSESVHPFSRWDHLSSVFFLEFYSLDNSVITEPIESKVWWPFAITKPASIETNFVIIWSLVLEISSDKKKPNLKILGTIVVMIEEIIGYDSSFESICIWIECDVEDVKFIGYEFVLVARCGVVIIIDMNAFWSWSQGPGGADNQSTIPTRCVSWHDDQLRDDEFTLCDLCVWSVGPLHLKSFVSMRLTRSSKNFLIIFSFFESALTFEWMNRFRRSWTQKLRILIIFQKMTSWRKTVKNCRSYSL